MFSLVTGIRFLRYRGYRGTYHSFKASNGSIPAYSPSGVIKHLAVSDLSWRVRIGFVYYTSHETPVL